MKIIRMILISALGSFLLACGGDGGANVDLRTDTCSVLGLQTRIVNGSECSTQNSPVVPITLITPDGDGLLCSGTMISSVHVLTAAHCFFEDISSAFITVNGKSIKGRSVAIHPGVSISDTAVFNDVAILKLVSSPNLPTVPLLASRPVTTGSKVQIYGFGITEGDPGDSSTAGTLRSGEMLVSNVTPNHIFAEFGGDGSNTCFGDSGGPAIFSFEENGALRYGIVGITSSGTIAGCRSGDVTLFANTQGDSIFDFITATVPGVGVI